MISPAVQQPETVVSDAEIEATFLEILPELQSRIDGCASKSPDSEEIGAEMMAHAWRNYQQAARNGTLLHPGLLVWVAWNAVRSGRRLCGSSCVDVHAAQCQRRKRSFVIHISSLVAPQQKGDVHARVRASFSECISQGYRDPADEAAAKIDWEALRDGLSNRLQRVLDGFAIGDRKGELARRLKLSPGRITQLKDELGIRVMEFFWNDNQ